MTITLTRRALLTGLMLTTMPPAATPSASPTPTPMRDRIDDILAIAPGELLAPQDPAGPIFGWVSPAAGAGLTSLDPLWRAELTGEPVADVFGFRPTAAREILSVGSLLDPVTWYDVPDPQHLIAHWEAADFQRFDAGTSAYWSIADDGLPDMSLPAAQIGASLVNCLTISAGRVIAARTVRRLVDATPPTPSPIMPDQVVNQARLLVDDDVDTILAWPGRALDAATLVPEGGDGTAALTESDAAVGPMPPALAIVGQHGPAGASWALRFASPDDAATAQDIVRWRLAEFTSPSSTVPYATSFAGVTVASAGPTLRLSFPPGLPADAWHEALINRDLWPIAWHN